MPFTVYILHSPHLNRYYIGLTGLQVEDRLNHHLEIKYSPRNFTAKANDWELKCSLSCTDAAHARRVELHIKRMKSRRYIEELISSEESRQALLDRMARK